jgi:hypothetical protein
MLSLVVYIWSLFWSLFYVMRVLMNVLAVLKSVHIHTCPHTYFLIRVRKNSCTEPLLEDVCNTPLHYT